MQLPPVEGHDRELPPLLDGRVGGEGRRGAGGGGAGTHRVGLSAGGVINRLLV